MSESEERLKDWIEKADHDLETAMVINQYIHDYSDTLAFHCQQAVEKYIKCLLEKNSIPFKKSHDLRYLLDLLGDVIPIEQVRYEQVMKLNAFGVESRFHDIKIDLSVEDRDESINIAMNFSEFVKQNVGFIIE